MSATDTIAALATPPGAGGIAVIRISGPQALPVADQVFRGRRRPSRMPGYTIAHGFVVGEPPVRPVGAESLPRLHSHSSRLPPHLSTFNSHLSPPTSPVIDEVLLSVFRAPRSYTGEEMIEISCHGGTAASHAILHLLFSRGVRAAEPGEFTRRAVLNGKLDLAQAEAVLELIQARNDRARDKAVGQLAGVFSDRVEQLRQELADIWTQLTALLEFGEELPIERIPHWNRALSRISQQLRRLIEQAESAPFLRQGALVVIVGKANVGKSSLFNQLVGEERAIVTEIPGTTRDCLEANLSLNGMMIRLVDTAGWRTRLGRIEAIGQARARHYAERADALLVVLDGSAGLTHEDNEVLAATADRRRILVLNKSDLKARAACRVPPAVNGAPQACVSAKKGKGINRLSRLITELFSNARTDGDFIATQRQTEALRKAATALKDAQASPILDVRAIEVGAAVKALEELLGKTTSDEVLDRVFSQFCVGK